jgi:hypothetical protein
MLVDPQTIDDERRSQQVGPTRHRRIGGLALVAAAVMFAAGCSGPDDQAYCDQLRAQVDLDARLGADPTAAVANLDALRELRSVAPESLEADLDVLIEAMQQFGDAAGAEPDPAERSEAGLRAIQPDLATIDTAGAAVADDALSRCDVLLPGGSTASTDTSPPTPTSTSSS